MKPIFSALITGLLISASAVGVGAQGTSRQAADTQNAKIDKGLAAEKQGEQTQAIEAWRSLADNGSAEAQFKLGQAYRLGQGTAVDLPLALDWFRKAAAQGHVEASDNVGQILVELGQSKEALPFIRASAERGEPHALYLYATNLFNGDVVERDWVTAYAMMTRATRAGITQARPSLVQMDRYISPEQREQGLSLAAIATTTHAAGTGHDAVGASDEVGAKTALPASASVVAAQVPIDAPAKNTAALSEPASAAATPTEKSAIGLTDVEPSTTTAIAASPAATPEARAAALPTPISVAASDKPAVPPPVEIKRSQTSTATPATAIAASGRWRVQLGAFREDGRAQDLWRTIRPKVSGLAALKPTYLPTNGLTRLIVGPIASVEEAQALCVRVRAAGAPCLALTL